MTMTLADAILAHRDLDAIPAKSAPVAFTRLAVRSTP